MSVALRPEPSVVMKRARGAPLTVLLVNEIRTPAWVSSPCQVGTVSTVFPSTTTSVETAPPSFETAIP